MISKYRKKNLQKLKEKATMLYQQGLNLRDVGKIIGRSHEWVRQAVIELEGSCTE